jgi:hypothetical protein
MRRIYTDAGLGLLAPFGARRFGSARLTAATASKEGNTVAKAIEGARENTRPRGKRPFAVWVTPEEKARIERLAAASGLSASTYLRTLGLGHEPKSLLDAERVGDLLKACADLQRLGGLLKLWLTDRPGEGAAVEDVRALLHSIGELRDQIVEKVAAV